MSSTLDATNQFLNGIDDIDAIIERIALGPQEEVLSLIQQLNHRWGTNFRCTPTFRWQPGFYKKLKEEAGKISKVNIQKNKVSTYKNQISNGRWAIDQFLTKIEQIDQKLYFLRNSGVIFQDNTEDVNRVLGEYKDTIESTMANALELYPNMNISVYHGLHTNGYHSNRSYNGTNHAISFHVYMENVAMNINIGGESVEIPMGNLDIIIAVDLVKNIMNRIRNVRITQGCQGSGHTNPWNGAIFHPQEPGILFPYISQEQWNRDQLRVAFAEGQNTRSGFSNVCFGSFDSEIKEAAWKGDILALFTYLNSWTKNFNVGRTGPLNGFQRMFHGIWPEMLTESWQASGSMSPTGRMDNCSYANVLNGNAPIQEHSYCDRYACTLRNDCHAYRAMYMPPEPIEDDEETISYQASNDRTLSEAELLRMYEGVNTINIGS
jgi:hypothetical protein